MYHQKCLELVLWSGHLRSLVIFIPKTLWAEVGTKYLLRPPTHPSVEWMYRLGFPDQLQVLTPRRAGDALAHSARGKTPDEDPCRAGGLIQKPNTYVKWSRRSSQNTTVYHHYNIAIVKGNCVPSRAITPLSEVSLLSCQHITYREKYRRFHHST